MRGGRTGAPPTGPTRAVVPSSRVAAAPTGGVVARRSGSNTRNVYDAPRDSERGREIRREMNQLADDFYGTGGNVPTPGTVELRGAVASMDQNGSELMCKGMPAVPQLPSTYYTGPPNPEGMALDSSDRNLLCMDVLQDKIVVGSADHGLKVFNAVNGRELRNLYGKKCGHTEWVTGCAWLPDGRIISGGMDSKLCLWHASMPRCDDFLGHTGSVSQVSVNHNSIAISSSYDRTLNIWNCNSIRAPKMSTLTGHGDPVMQFVWYGNAVLSGDRKGKVILWDVTAGSSLAKLTTVGGQIGALGYLCDDSNNIALAGDQSGTLSAWDFRASGATPIFQSKLHPGGVLSGIKSSQMTSSNVIVTAGADKRILVMDPRNMAEPLNCFTEHRDFIYSLETYGNLILSGAGNGWLLVHHVQEPQCLYALGANQAAVRCINANERYIVAAGDDGKAMVYAM